MKKLSGISLLLMALLFVNCQNTNPGHEADLALVAKYQEALKNFDYETMKSCLADDFMRYGPSLGDSMNRDDALLNWKYNIENIYSKLEYKGSRNIVVTSTHNGKPEEWVSSWGRLFIKYKDHGNEAEIWSNTLYLIEDGKIKRTMIFYNEADALRQAGYSYVFKEPTVIEE